MLLFRQVSLATLVKLKPVSLQFRYEVFVTGVNRVPEFRALDPGQPGLDLGPEFEPEPRPLHLHQHTSDEEVGHGLPTSGQVVVARQVALLQRFQVTDDVTQGVLRQCLVVVVVRERVLFQELWIDVVEADSSVERDDGFMYSVCHV